MYTREMEETAAAMAQQFSEFLAELNARVHLEDVVGEYVQLKQKGHRYWGLCRFTAKNPRPSAWMPTHSYIIALAATKAAIWSIS